MPRRHVHDGMGAPTVIAFLADARIEMNKHPGALTTYAEMSSRFCSFAPSIASNEMVESKVAKRP
jgi:hypothetical protein